MCILVMCVSANPKRVLESKRKNKICNFDAACASRLATSYCKRPNSQAFREFTPDTY